MRQVQSQQNRNRSRGRNHSNRNKGGNQINRNMESNGPDVKIRGTPTHIAEKYSTLAGDAHSSGDLVAAENYYQHAEHYNRLIATAQAAQTAQIAQRETNRNDEQRRRPASVEGQDSQGTTVGNEPPAEISDNQDSVTPVGATDGSGPQPVFNETPAEVTIGQSMINGGIEDEVGSTTPAETPRRPRRAARRPRKDATAESDEKDAKSPTETSPELPAFIVGANDS